MIKAQWWHKVTLPDFLLNPSQLQLTCCPSADLYSANERFLLYGCYFKVPLLCVMFGMSWANHNDGGQTKNNFVLCCVFQTWELHRWMTRADDLLLLLYTCFYLQPRFTTHSAHKPDMPHIDIVQSAIKILSQPSRTMWHAINLHDRCCYAFNHLLLRHFILFFQLIWRFEPLISKAFIVLVVVITSDGNDATDIYVDQSTTTSKPENADASALVSKTSVKFVRGWNHNRKWPENMQLRDFKRLVSACDKQQLVTLGKLSKAKRSKKEQTTVWTSAHI